MQHDSRTEDPSGVVTLSSLGRLALPDLHVAAV
jgi:hypothetical protein